MLPAIKTTAPLPLEPGAPEGKVAMPHLTLGRPLSLDAPHKVGGVLPAPTQQQRPQQQDLGEHTNQNWRIPVPEPS